jgi:hypothetical protein
MRVSHVMLPDVKVAWCRGCMRNTSVFAAGHGISYWSGCIKTATMICQQIFLILELVICLLKNQFKKCKICFWLWRRDPVLELQFLTPLRVVLLCFAIQYLEIAL